MCPRKTKNESRPSMCTHTSDENKSITIKHKSKRQWNENGRGDGREQKKSVKNYHLPASESILINSYPPPLYIPPSSAHYGRLLGDEPYFLPNRTERILSGFAIPTEQLLGILFKPGEVLSPDERGPNLALSRVNDLVHFVTRDDIKRRRDLGWSWHLDLIYCCKVLSKAKECNERKGCRTLGRGRLVR